MWSRVSVTCAPVVVMAAASHQHQENRTATTAARSAANCANTERLVLQLTYPCQPRAPLGNADGHRERQAQLTTINDRISAAIIPMADAIQEYRQMLALHEDKAES
jgi:hypothetical protein